MAAKEREVGIHSFVQMDWPFTFEPRLGLQSVRSGYRNNSGPLYLNIGKGEITGDVRGSTSEVCHVNLQGY